jgi:hypothetical protein
MFSADLSWTGENYESVRDRRQRREREARQTPSASSDNSSTHSKKSYSRQWKENVPFKRSRDAVSRRDDTAWNYAADCTKAFPSQHQLASIKSDISGTGRGMILY